jgi:DNA-directed RNA polymerase subunit RPC12/RpoP
MIRICAWCGKDLGENDAEPKEAISHGMCEDCRDKVVSERTKNPQEKTFTNCTHLPGVSAMISATENSHF